MLKSVAICSIGLVFATTAGTLAETNQPAFDCTSWAKRFASKFPELINEQEERAECLHSIVTSHATESEAAKAARECPADVSWSLPDDRAWLAFCHVTRH